MTDNHDTAMNDKELQVKQAVDFFTAIDFKDAKYVQKNKEKISDHIFTLAGHCSQSPSLASGHVLDLMLATMAKNGHTSVLEELSQAAAKSDLHPTMTGAIAEYHKKSQNPNARYDMFAYDLSNNNAFRFMMDKFKSNLDLTEQEALTTKKAIVNLYTGFDDEMIEMVDKFHKKFVPAA